MTPSPPRPAAASPPPELVRIVEALALQAADEDYRRAQAEASACNGRAA